jgi:hypothetical protein
MSEDWIREDYFLMFDVSRTTLLPLRDIKDHLPLYKKKGDEITKQYAPRLFTKDKLEKFGVLDEYELYQNNCDKT